MTIPPFILYGFSSATVFLALTLIGFSSLFLVVSSVPLMLLSKQYSFDFLLKASAVASLLLLLFSGASALFYIALICVPTILLCAHLKAGNSFIQAIADIGGYSMVAIAGVQLSLLNTGGIQGWITTRFSADNMQSIDPSLALQMQWLMQEGSFLLISIVVWWTVIFLFFSYWISANLLQLKDKSKPLSLFASPGSIHLPAWLLAALLLSILAALLGTENVKFLGMTSFVIILLPYFFYGAIHTPLRRVLERSIGWSLVGSVVLMVLAWPAFAIAALGVFKHTQTLIR